MKPFLAWRLGKGFCLILSLAACSHQPAPITVQVPHEVPVPVPIACSPPADLTADLALPAPTFRAPTEAGVTSGLLPADETALMQRDALLRQRLRAWAAWNGCGVGK